MGILDRWKKKPWMREDGTYIFVLQEYAGSGRRGWYDVTEPTGAMISKKDAQEHFKPGRYYRVLCKDTDSGKMVGVVWKHTEFGPLEAKKKAEEGEEEEGKERRGGEPASPAEVMGAYAEQLRADLEPLASLGQIMKEIRDSFSFGEGGSSGGGEGGMQMPALEFEGKAPWMMHPYIVKNIGDTVKEVIDHAAARFGLGEAGGKEEEKEEEEGPILPKISTYRKPPPTKLVLTTARGRRRVPAPKREEPTPIEKGEEEKSPLELEEKEEDKEEEEK